MPVLPFIVQHLLYVTYNGLYLSIQVRLHSIVAQVALPRSATESNVAPAVRPKEVIGTISSLVPKIHKKRPLGQLASSAPRQNLRLPGINGRRRRSRPMDLEKI